MITMAQRGGAVRTLAAIPNLDALFNARVRQGVKFALADERGSVGFDAPPGGSWTIRFDRGRVRLLSRLSGLCLIGGGVWLAVTRTR